MSELRREISRAAWIPVIRGMAMSRMARSTASPVAAAMASAPSAATATTFRSGSASMIRRSPWRTRAWSSASRILVGPPFT